MSRDNGEAGAEGQRPRAAFPKGFERVLRRFCPAFCWTYGRI
jgi:hypothetical protein